MQGGGPTGGPQVAGGGSPGAQENPVVKWYRDWSARTPLITRYTIHLIVVLWILTWFVDISYAILNVPFYTILHYEVYRLVLSPLYTEGLISVLFVVMTLQNMGPRIEQALGSTSFALLMAQLALLTNLLFLTICFVVYACGMPEALFWQAGSFWLIVLGLVSVDCLLSPMPTRQLFMLPYQIPSAYFPLVMWALFSLFTGPRLDMACAVGLGYAEGYGYLKRIKPSERTVGRWEASDSLSSLVSKPGYITQAHARGNQAWLPVNAPVDHPSAPSSSFTSGGPISGFSNLGGAARPSAPSQPSASSFQGGGGHKLGSAPAAPNGSTRPTSSIPGGGGGGGTSGGASGAGSTIRPSARDIAEARAAKLAGHAESRQQGGDQADTEAERDEEESQHDEETATLLHR